LGQFCQTIIKYARAGRSETKMDKAEYVAKAPFYYALAIAATLDGAPGPMTDYKIRAKYPHYDDSPDPEPGTLLGRSLAWDRAVQWLTARGMVLTRYDSFGPPIYSKTADSSARFDELTEDETLPFASWNTAGRTDDWGGWVSQRLDPSPTGCSDERC
jgi:hypothetical protein